MNSARQIAFNLIRKNRAHLAHQLRQVVAFDTRFSLYQKDIKYLYLLEHPVFDQRFEIIYENGDRKLVTDKAASKILSRELEYNEMIREKAAEQVKKANKLARMSEIPIGKELRQLKKDIEKEAPDVAPKMEVHHDDSPKPIEDQDG